MEGARRETPAERLHSQSNGGHCEVELLVKPLGQQESDGSKGLWGAKGPYYWLSILSVILGCSCVGVYSLINAVRAQERGARGDLEAARECRARAVKFSALSFVVLVMSVLMALGLVVAVSYLVRLVE